jgi:hypothetical protein
MTRTNTYGVLASGFFLLGVASFLVFLQAANEPFVHFRANEALIQVGVASVLAALWIFFGAGLCFLAAKRRVSLWSLLTLFPVALALWVMVDCPFGYVADIAHFVVGGR